MSDDHLTHGWEPDLPVEDSLLRRFVLANRSRGRLLSAAASGRVLERDDVFATDPASPVLFDNIAILLQPSGVANVGDAVDALLEFFPPDRHFALLSAWPTPDLSVKGLVLMGHPPFMFRPAGGQPPPLPAGVEIREVGSAVALNEFVATLCEAYPLPGGESSPVADPALLGSAIRLFTAYLDHAPVATSGAYVGEGIVDVEWVSTRTEARGRGIGAAVTWAAALADPALPSTLIASDLGQPVYEAMGYLRLMRLTMWHRPPA